MLDATTYRISVSDVAGGNNLTYVLSKSTGSGYTQVKSGTISSGGTLSFTSTEERLSSNIKLQKVSGNTALTNGVDTYSLTGAKYTLYEGNYTSGTSSSAAIGWQNAKALKTYTTGSDGTFTTGDLRLNNSSCSYYLKETTASPGYALDKTIWYIHIMNDGTGLKYSICCSTDGGSSFKDVALSVALSNGGTISITSKEPPKTAKIKLGKVSGNTTITSGVDTYSLAGAVYTLYEGKYTDENHITASGWKNAKVLGTYTTGSDGTFTISDLRLNKASYAYYLRETTPSAGYTLDTSIWYIHIMNDGTGLKYSLCCSTDGGSSFKDVDLSVPLSNGGTISITSTEPPKTAKIKLQKVSGDTALTDGNSCYSLAGAVYTLYEGDYTGGTGSTVVTGWKNAKALGTYTTGSDGTFTTGSIRLNNSSCSYYLKETTASPGYALDETIWYIHIMNDGTGLKYSLCYSTNGGSSFKDAALSVPINSGDTISVTSTEPPLNDPFALILQKMDYDTGLPTVQGSAALEGALFQVDYYDNTAGTATGTPFRTWVFATDANGKLYCDDEDYLVSDMSDELYKDSDGDVVYLLGTYTIKEIQPPKYYKLEGTMKFVASGNEASVTDGLKLVIAQDASGNPVIYEGNSIGIGSISAANLAINVYDEVYKGSVKVFKYDTDGKTPLPGVGFKLVGDDGSEYTGTTDSNGEILFEELIPQHYVLTETSTVDGHTLLRDNIDITLPFEMTEQEANAQGADLSKAVWDEQAGVYCFYDATYEVSNSVKFIMPVSGGDQGPLFAVLAFSFTLIIGGLVFIFRKRKFKTNIWMA